jgi:hypothetical protein
MLASSPNVRSAKERQKAYSQRMLILRVSLVAPGVFEQWRRRRDSNPRDPFGPNGFQDRRFQPLTHSSVSKYNLQQPLAERLVTIWKSIAAFWCTAVDPILETE